MVDATIIGPNASKRFEFMVDTGSAVVGLPEEDIQELGLIRVPNSRTTFLTSEGPVEDDIYSALGELGGRGFIAGVTRFSRPVIGYLVLEFLMLKVNPVTGTLEPFPDAHLGHVKF